MMRKANNSKAKNSPQNGAREPRNDTAKFSESQALEELKKRNERKEKELSAKEEELNKREADLEKQIKDADPKIAEAAEKEAKADEMFKAAQQTAEKQKKYAEELTKREARVTQAELSLDWDLDKRRRDFEDELLEKMKTTNEELEAKRSELLKQTEQRLADVTRECEQMRANTAAELSKWRSDEMNNFNKNLESETNATLSALKQRQDELAKEKQSVEEKQAELNFELIQNSRRKKTIEDRAARLDEEAKEEAKKIAAGILSEKEALEEQCNMLREEIKRQQADYEACESLKNMLGDNPAVIQRALGDAKAKIAELEGKLANAASRDVVEENKNLKQRIDGLLAQKSELEKKNGELSDTLREVRLLEGEINVRAQEIDNLNKIIEEYRQENEGLHEKIKRLSSAETRPAERNERLRALFDLHSTQVPFIEAEARQPKSEIEWLGGIQENCKKLGLVFPKRILYAFHTALKIADWSTVTVLAGVSGTGKSELPRLYSEFGGINFISVPVQPNWDCQEAMLGYFNSIDNRFDSQPLLRFLVQCTETFDKKDEEMQNLLTELKTENYKPLNKYMSIVLLDEMNLAHVEHYFADFLSKLESRRGKGRIFVPTIEVKLGAGIKPYDLRLSRNVLWAGTMNQDETTKSLSDKVLDRGIVINFPRPKTLKERPSLKTSLDRLKKESEIPFLEKETWDKWQLNEIPFKGDQLKELENFKKIVEEINGYLSYAGRAIGHRVWQSIEYYIANYPDVIQALSEAENGSLTDDLKKAMHIAFEDQIVQKIMPKLRGIDTGGDSKRECLDKIKALLESPGCRFNLSEDFDIACRLGYGQFIWCSANYIDAGDGVVDDFGE